MDELDSQDLALPVCFLLQISLSSTGFCYARPQFCKFHGLNVQVRLAFFYADCTGLTESQIFVNADYRQYSTNTIVKV